MEYSIINSLQAGAGLQVNKGTKLRC